jgi:hypothetical protein
MTTYCDFAIRLSSIALLFRNCPAQARVWLFISGTSRKTHQCSQTEASIDSLNLESFEILSQYLHFGIYTHPGLFYTPILKVICSQFSRNQNTSSPVWNIGKICVMVFFLNLIRNKDGFVLSAYHYYDIWGASL